MFKVMGWLSLLFIIFSVLHPLEIRAQGVNGASIQKITKNQIDYEVVTFSSLRFQYQPPFDVEHPDGTVTKGSKTRKPIPAEIKALNGKKVAIKAYVLPLDSSGQTVKTFLMADQLVSCLFCAMLGYDEWIKSETVNPQGIAISDDQLEEPVIVFGTLEMGEEIQDGQLLSFYRFKADAFEPKRQKIFGLF